MNCRVASDCGGSGGSGSKGYLDCSKVVCRSKLNVPGVASTLPQATRIIGRLLTCCNGSVDLQHRSRPCGGVGGASGGGRAGTGAALAGAAFGAAFARAAFGAAFAASTVLTILSPTPIKACENNGPHAVQQPK